MQGDKSSKSVSDFEFLGRLGKGSFGVVYKVKRKADKSIYVLKQISISNMSSRMRSTALNEVKILSALENPYIVKYYDSFIEKNYLNIVMEYCDGGDLAGYIKGQLGRPMPENKIWKFFIQMCVGMNYIHSKKILHRDIKAMNIFMTKSDEIRIGDLGVAKMLAESANFAHTMVGTPYYLSPEMCEEKPYNEKSDIWALGCVLYEMCTSKHPFDANNQAALILKIIRGRYQAIPSTYSKDLVELVDACLSRDYRKRPTSGGILNMQIVQNKAKLLDVKIELAPEKKRSKEEKSKKPDIPKPKPQEKPPSTIDYDSVNARPQLKRGESTPSQKIPVTNNLAQNNNNAQKDVAGNENKNNDQIRQKPWAVKDAAFNQKMPPKRASSDAKMPSQKKLLGPKDQKIDLQNNNLFKIHFENKERPPIGNSPSVAQTPKGNPNQQKVVNLNSQFEVPSDSNKKENNPFNRNQDKPPMNPYRDNNPDRNNVKRIRKGAPQQLGKNAAVPVGVAKSTPKSSNKDPGTPTSRPQLLEDREKPPFVKDIIAKRQQEADEVKNLPDAFPRKNPHQVKVAHANNGLFDKNKKAVFNNIVKEHRQHKTDDKVDDSKESVFRQETVDDDFIKREFGPDSKNNKKSESPNKSVNTSKPGIQRPQQSTKATPGLQQFKSISQEPIPSTIDHKITPEVNWKVTDAEKNLKIVKVKEDTKGDNFEHIPVTYVEKDNPRFETFDATGSKTYARQDESSEEEAYDENEENQDGGESDDEDEPYTEEEEKSPLEKRKEYPATIEYETRKQFQTVSHPPTSSSKVTKQEQKDQLDSSFEEVEDNDDDDDEDDDDREERKGNGFTEYDDDDSDSTRDTQQSAYQVRIEGIKKKLEAAKKKEENLDQLIKLRTNECVKSLGEKTFKEVIDFFRQKLRAEEDLNEEDQEEIDNFVRDKLGNSFKIQHAVYVINKILWLEIELNRCQDAVKKYNFELA